MRVLIVSQYFWPESFIINDLAKTLRNQGHTIVVATGKPNYPEGTIFDGYTATGTQQEMFDGDILVVRVPMRPRRTGGGLNLFLNYLSFVVSGLRWFPSLLGTRAFDVILVFGMSPITMAIPAIRLKRTKKAHLAIWVQDLWPQSLAATGFIHNRFLLWLVGLVVRWIYHSADTLLVQSRAFIEPVSRYAARENIVYYPNSLLSSQQVVTDDAALPSDLLRELRTHFCVVFTGNVGIAQAVDTFVDAACLVSDLPDVRLVLVGGGSMLEWVRREKDRRAVDNLIIAGRLPHASMHHVYRNSACLVVTLKDEEIFAYTIPAKVQAYLAAGKPIIAALNGEGARIVAESGAGLICGAEDSRCLAASIRTLRALPESERARMGKAGERYFADNFEMNRQAAWLIDTLQSRSGAPGGQS